MYSTSSDILYCCVCMTQSHNSSVLFGSRVTTSFRDREELKLHIAAVHVKCFNYICEICSNSARFSTAAALHTHYCRDHCIQEYTLQMYVSPETMIQKRQLKDILTKSLLYSNQRNNETTISDVRDQCSSASKFAINQSCSTGNQLACTSETESSFVGSSSNTSRHSSISTMSCNDSTTTTVRNDDDHDTDTHATISAVTDNRRTFVDAVIKTEVATEENENNTIVITEMQQGTVEIEQRNIAPYASSSSPDTDQTPTTSFVHQQQLLPESDQHSSTRKMCSLCNRLIITAQRGFYPLYDHVSAVHLRQSMYTCRLCGKSSTAYISGNIRSHVRRRHGTDINPGACIVSHRHLYANELKRLMNACFNVQ